MTPSSSQPDLDKLGGQALREVLGTLLGVAASEIEAFDTAATESSREPLAGGPPAVPAGSSPDVRPGRERRTTPAPSRSMASEPGCAVRTVYRGALVATVQLTGQRISGAVHLRIPRRFAEQAVVRLVGETQPRRVSDTDVADFAGELGNILAGQVAARLRSEGYACALGTPGVVSGSRGLPPLKPAPDAHRSRTDWACQGHRLTLEMRFRYRPT